MSIIKVNLSIPNLQMRKQGFREVKQPFKDHTVSERARAQTQKCCLPPKVCFVFTIHSHASQSCSLVNLLKCIFLGSSTRSSDSAGPRQGLKFCTSDQLSDDAALLTLGPHRTSQSWFGATLFKAMSSPVLDFWAGERDDHFGQLHWQSENLRSQMCWCRLVLTTPLDCLLPPFLTIAL